MITRRTLAFIAATAAASLAAAPAMAQTKLKFAHVYETSEPFHTEAVWAAGEFAKRTNNKYQIDVFPASQLGKETDINQGLSLGSVYASPIVRRRATVDFDANGTASEWRWHFPGAFPSKSYNV